MVSEILSLWKLGIVIELITEGLERKTVTVQDFLDVQGFKILLFSYFDLCWNNICTISLLKCIFNQECEFAKGCINRSWKTSLFVNARFIFCLGFFFHFEIKLHSHCNLCMTLIPSLIKNPGTNRVPAKAEYLSPSNSFFFFFSNYSIETFFMCFLKSHGN